VPIGKPDAVPGDGLEAIFGKHGLDWRAPAIGGRSAWVVFPELPHTAAESYCSLDRRFVETRRLFMPNRGIREAIRTAGPALSFADPQEDVDRYIDVADAFRGPGKKHKQNLLGKSLHAQGTLERREGSRK